MANDRNKPLVQIVRLWLEKLRQAREWKHEVFGRQAAENLRFYGGNHKFMFADDGRFGEDDAGDAWRPTVNKTFEAVAVIAPHLYFKNPVRLVLPRTSEPLDLTGLADPAFLQQAAMAEEQRLRERSLRASLLGEYLNYTPGELDLRRHSLKAIDEAIIKGVGVQWVETKQRPGSPVKLVGSFYDNVDNLLIDPDFEMLEDAHWIARKCCHPVWQVARDYGLPEDELRANRQSTHRAAEIETSGASSSEKKTAKTCDKIEYWKIYSKMGMGTRLEGDRRKNIPESLKEALDSLGDYVYLVVAEGIDYPLNLPPAMHETPLEEIKSAVQWPIPFYADGRWPVNPLWFHDVPGQAWGMGHLTPAMGEQKFLNWNYSYLANKVRFTSRQFVAVLESAFEDVEDTLKNGGDLSILKLKDMHQDINKVIQWVHQQAMSGDQLTVASMIERNFERRTGLTDMMYGESRVQERSAAESQNKMQMTKIRTDHMAEITEAWAGNGARMEALAASWVLGAQDVAPILGPVKSRFWAEYVQMRHPDEITREVDYTIESGSMAKPNPDREAGNIREAMQFALPIAMQLAQVNPQNFDLIQSLFAKLAKTQGEPADAYKIYGPLPPPPTPVGPDGQPLPPQGPPGPPQGPPPDQGQAPPPGAPPMDPAMMMNPMMMGGPQ